MLFLDMLISLYQCKFKVRRWHMKIFFHYIDLTVVNAWLLYQLEFRRTHPGGKYMDLYKFKRNISEVWIKNNSSTPPTTNTRGDSRRTSTITVPELHHGAARPPSSVPLSVRFDPKWHLPFCFSGYDDRHRCAQCKKWMTNVFCMKCEVFLCCKFQKSCYLIWHTEYEGQIVSHFPEYLIPENSLEHVPDDQENDPDDLQNVLDDLEDPPEDQGALQEDLDLPDLAGHDLDIEFSIATQIEQSNDPETEQFNDA